MPFQSKAQMGYLFANHPDLAKEFAAKTPNMKALPQHAGKKKARREAYLSHMKGSC